MSKCEPYPKGLEFFAVPGVSGSPAMEERKATLAIEVEMPMGAIDGSRMYWCHQKGSPNEKVLLSHTKIALCLTLGKGMCGV